MMARRMRGLYVLGAMICGTYAAANDYHLQLKDTGMRDYYCTMTISLTNRSDHALTEINGFFLLFQDGEQVGRSKGTSFHNVAPGATAEAVFDTPNAPCADAEERRFIVGACRIGAGFEAKSVCADALSGDDRIVIDTSGS